MPLNRKEASGSFFEKSFVKTFSGLKHLAGTQALKKRYLSETFLRGTWPTKKARLMPSLLLSLINQASLILSGIA